jgi:hypothetical protein
MAGEQPAQSLDVDPPSIQCGVKATPAAAMRRFEAQVNRRRNAIRNAIGGEEGIGELEESIGPTMEAYVE